MKVNQKPRTMSFQLLPWLHQHMMKMEKPTAALWPLQQCALIALQQ